MMPSGSVNAWKCHLCGELTVAVQRADGVTPFLLACRASGDLEGCPGTGESLMYQPGFMDTDPDWPEPQWEWVIPSRTKMKHYKRSNPEMYQHVKMGGLELRKIGKEAHV